MTFVVKMRGAVEHGGQPRPMLAEYLCETGCGRFDLLVERDAAGDPPDRVDCPECGDDSFHVISAPRSVRVRKVEASRGGWEKPERKTYLDTRNLGEGQDLTAWRAEREKIRDEQRRAQLKELIDNGPAL